MEIISKNHFTLRTFFGCGWATVLFPYLIHRRALNSRNNKMAKIDFTFTHQFTSIVRSNQKKKREKKNFENWS